MKIPLDYRECRLEGYNIFIFSLFCFVTNATVRKVFSTGNVNFCVKHDTDREAWFMSALVANDNNMF